MKNLLIPISAICLLVFISCDKVENPIPIEEGAVDWTLFPGGDPATYPYPTWTANTNVDRNVLIEDFTGHVCTNCPAAAVIASTLETNNPGRVFVASIHASLDGSFQGLEPPEFITDFTTIAGNTYATEIDGFVGNPMGTTNRTLTGYQPGVIWQLDSKWVLNTNDLLTTNDLSANLQLKYNYYPSTNSIFVHTETEFVSELEGTYNIVLYLIRDTVIAPQKLITGATEEEYHHHSVLTDNINGSWGTQMVSGTVAVGEKFYNNFSYQIPTTDSTFNIENLSLITYVCNRETYEILQVIKTKL
jgi:hypothetical protein